MPIVNALPSVGYDQPVHSRRVIAGHPGRRHLGRQPQQAKPAQRAHHYRVEVAWTGNRGEGTSGYRAYGRSHQVVGGDGKPPILGSSDPAFRGEADRWNPEELLVASLSQCHMLWFLHLAAVAGVVVVAYTDRPEGTMIEDLASGRGRFSEVVLRPAVTVADAGMVERAGPLHERAHQLCYIANSVNFLVRQEPATTVA
jgi:organic hydroperoxide reductase OsmC/OhrA